MMDPAPLMAIALGFLLVALLGEAWFLWRGK
jgi:hypothetical protein